MGFFTCKNFLTSFQKSGVKILVKIRSIESKFVGPISELRPRPILRFIDVHAGKGLFTKCKLMKIKLTLSCQTVVYLETVCVYRPIFVLLHKSTG